MARLFSDKSSVRVLDVGAGTGLTGVEVGGLKFLHAHKYARNLQNSYDAVCIVGSFGPGAIPPSALSEFARVIKPGGYIVNCMREEYIWTVPQYKDKLVPYLEDMEKQGLIQQVEWYTYPGHYQDKAGVRMVYRVC
ncbi:Williams-Beuren syndrome chromosomal region 27 protein [Elysia marginata]|uniref:Williams-Beuren syndrome chromosomal region 27 protein n=1 Tax=Elysia marginata TaxID=1093978 RepID=A0AAV4ELE4_9GAST|nr:Williams-Beuren syndrome chromosomal region 27 protein [Elysia marginata]